MIFGYIPTIDVLPPKFCRFYPIAYSREIHSPGMPRMSPETGVGDHLLKPVNLLSRKVHRMVEDSTVDVLLII